MTQDAIAFKLKIERKKNNKFIDHPTQLIKTSFGELKSALR